MVTGFRRAFLFAAVFVILKAILETVLVSPFFLFEKETVNVYRHGFKLLLSVSFLVPVFILQWIQTKLGPSFYPFIQQNPYDGQPVRNFWNHPFTWIALLLGFSTGFQILGHLSEVVYRLFFECDDSIASFMKFVAPTGHPLDVIGAILTIGILGPVAEELIFRGWIQNGLTRNYPDRMGMVLVFQGLLFGISHMNAWQILYAAPLGVVLGFLRYRTGSIGAPLLVHMSSNLMAVIYLYWFAASEEFTDPCEVPIQFQPWILLVAVASLGVSFAHIMKNTRSGVSRGSGKP